MIFSKAERAPSVSLINGVLVTGKTGSGKTSTAKRLIEELYGYHPIDQWHADLPRTCILDPIKSDWWGITLDSNGKDPALPFVILGGPHGHVPLSDTAGTAIGELVASGRLPMSILDMSLFKMGGLQRFYCDFAEAIFRNNKRPLNLVVEEAHEFAPKERSGIGAENMAVYWSKKLATAGRSKGIRMIACTQRTQSLHNAVMGSLETLLAHRMTYPADVDPVIDWVQRSIGKSEAKAIGSAMSQLINGEAFVCHAGKVVRWHFAKMQTFDNTKTPDGTETDAAPPPVDRKQLLEIVGDAVKEAEENDVTTLKARIKHLEIANLAKNLGPVVDISADLRAEYDRGYQSGHAEGKADALRAGQAVLFGLRDRLKEEINNLFGPSAAIPPTSGKTESRPSPSPTPLPRDPRAVVARVDTARGGGVGAGAKRLIETVQRFYVDGAPGFEWSQLRILSGMRAGGYFNTAKSEAVASGLLDVDNGLVKPTFLSASAKRPRREDLREIWISKLGELGGQIFHHVLESKVTTTRELQEALDKKPGGYWNTHMAAVRDAGLIESRGGKVFLSDFLESLQ
jgi:hypothetical protein